MNSEKVVRQFNKIKKIVSKTPEALKMRLAAEGWGAEWKILIITIMSARSLDETTIKVGNKLFEKFDSVKKLSEASVKDVEEIMRPVNFYKNKSRSVVSCCKVLFEKYSSKVPRDFDKLLELSGVGRKTANIFLSEIGEDAIGVDTHVFYVSNKLGWSKGGKPEKVEEDLKEFFPKKMWRELNPTIVRFGKTHRSKKEKDRILEEIKKI
ncbi:MAG: endonuclease III [Candidatus Pacearchaeota archaeon]|nr:endonuclease III [Candidatus Pacearchaeota archaeon]